VAPLTLAIIGAGPFGLAQAAWAADAGVDYAIIGYPMEFWREHMPVGMLLRSTAEWHLDPPGEWTIDRFFAEQG
jgi:cation diffusion facilitator CzcD-associated flavoprotein CzcO